MRRVVAPVVLAVAAAVCGITVPVHAAVLPTAETDTWTPRAEEYPSTVTQTDLEIPMSDGTVLRGDLQRPVDAAGHTVTQPLPTIVTITAYNKSVQGSAGGLAGGDPAYLVKRGYLHLTVDARGTGSSEGVWCAFCAREAQDFGEVMQWVHEQPWTNGDTAMMGPSYMGISQMFAASARPDGLKAIFPQVPGADVYRDIVASGGVLDVGFIPLWLGLVNATALVPPAYTAQNPMGSIGELLTQLIGNGAFSSQLMLAALFGGEPAYDGEFYTQRSPIYSIDQVDVPTFFISGEYDLFQRGTPLLYENLQQRGVPTKMIIGPWDHLQGSGGTGVEDAGYGSLAELQLRWFDAYVKGLPGQDLDRIAGLSYYEQGSGAWVRGEEWMPDSLQAATYLLDGSAVALVSPGGLTTSTPTSGETIVPALPTQGLCTRSTNQWTAGILTMVLPSLPCFSDNQLNDAMGPVFQTEPLTEDLVIHGPANVRLYTSTPAGNGVYSVSLSDVAPDGTVSRLTGGWQLVSARALDESRSRYLDGTLVQAYHPFTKDSQATIPSGAVEPVDVEIFPTRARIREGHRLRVSVQAFDLPHALPIIGDLPSALVPLTVHSGAQYPSSVSFGTPSAPTVGGLVSDDDPDPSSPDTPSDGGDTDGDAAGGPDGDADPAGAGGSDDVVPASSAVTAAMSAATLTSNRDLLPSTGAQTYTWMLLLAWAALAGGSTVALRARQL
ncbi:MAG TPA: CocE/NonD family hydrolase [Aeromicrobium sp.]|nr:CocE/NonD family hydrolase [Aeromicrobium sp.]